MASQNLSGGDIFGGGEGMIPSAVGGYEPIVITDADVESNLKSLSQFEIYWRRFRRHRLALIGAGTLLLLVLMAIFAPLITPGVGPTTVPAFELGVPLGGAAHPPTLDNFPWRIFGTTNMLNYSILAQITYGARVSLLVSFLSAVFTTIIGTVIGSVSGYFGGWVDNLMMRITDVFLSIPLLPLLITIAAIYAGSGSVESIIVILSIFSWAGISRLVRSLILSLREVEFVEAAKAVGVRDWRIIFRHILPNVLSPVIVTLTLFIATFVSLEATLDFLGLGIKYPTISWGNMLTNAQNDLLVGDWWWAFFPGLFLVITVLAVNFIGDGLRDALDVRTRID